MYWLSNWLAVLCLLLLSLSSLPLFSSFSFALDFFLWWNFSETQTFGAKSIRPPKALSTVRNVGAEICWGKLKKSWIARRWLSEEICLLVQRKSVFCLLVQRYQLVVEGTWISTKREKKGDCGMMKQRLMSEFRSRTVHGQLLVWILMRVLRYCPHSCTACQKSTEIDEWIQIKDCTVNYWCEFWWAF